MAYIPTKKTDFDTRLAPLLPDYSHVPPDARITELLQTNAPPTTIERDRLEATLSETPVHVAELDSLIDLTTSLLHYLINDRNQALENQANAKKILSPSRQIPPGLLTDIFIRCLPLYGRRTPLDPRALPWTLSHVCRNWRVVAIATPELWSIIYLSFVDDRFLNGSRTQEAAFMLGVFLDRARPHDLEVEIWLKDGIYAHPAFPVLLPSVRYWKSLDIFGGSADLGFLSPCRGFFDRLETALVWGEHHGGSEAIDTFAVAPRLRSFTKIFDAPFLLPANLVEFDDGNLFNENTCTTLRQLVNIQTLSLSCSPYSSESPRIRLPRASQLELRVVGQTTGLTSVTYNNFDLPSLTHLKVMFYSLQLMVPRPVPQPMHSSTVTRLTVTWSLSHPHKFSAVDIEQHLSSYNTLRNLCCFTIKDCPNIRPFLLALSIRSGKNVIFPKLSKVDIIWERDAGLSEDALDMHILVELIQSRRDQGALREFNMKWERRLVNDDADTRSRWQQVSAPGGGIQISASIKGLEANSL
ncbi:hypothetical protein EDD18DRAFT_539210 [Armillaria luteobubalina]|uniref:F-box domain-containing protein n=1 Tax=Armillaria luteobubalina TaxID=153913 RepID=A0AA39UJA8_9AGAR|nr:hypothetical protein EDD18DRAFT_539210 [Armillaria luteobubalina]